MIVTDFTQRRLRRTKVYDATSGRRLTVKEFTQCIRWQEANMIGLDNYREGRGHYTHG